MTTLNLTEKFSPLVDERFAPSAVTTASTNQDYEFTGAKGIKITSVQTVEMNDYKRSGQGRYGQADELGNDLQEEIMKKDRSFTFTMDKMNEEESEVKVAPAIARQMREVVIPEIETYRLKVMSEGAGTKVDGAITKTNAYESFLAGQETLDDHFVPENRVCHATPTFINKLKLDDNYTKASDLAQGTILLKGQVGEVDGVAIIKTPKSFMNGQEFIITHKSATVAPVKLAETKVHLDPPGISGTLVEGRFYYDAFVLDMKKNAIYAHAGKVEKATAKN
ncbi:hypothetical protein BK718_15645 [Bacillus thuringiensis serovar andalousiensis]|uniref:Major capsid protein n=3 Tax=root TaxID=1 RepID=K4M4C3_9CAUD|nr:MULTISPECIES: hypothetical protein [Bacillus]YP_007236403.1 major head protein [Bacillus phage vB_BtS_BMBtp2]AGV99406.1 hypothetical protein proCM3_gp44 [Bacillus phage proCM3]AFV15438.1 hypothetical protein ISGA_45 [Bacillus phage vB_BtS_BMBtp2]AJQ58673.1 hypothetical protein SD98_10300 [Bacillus thuringiensis serovar morrisoni]MCU4871117.1 hypothetical protein [Bacillus cereus]MDA2127874.1 hypothetical protein [Bacillus cereus]